MAPSSQCIGHKKMQIYFHLRELSPGTMYPPKPSGRYVKNMG